MRLIVGCTVVVCISFMSISDGPPEAQNDVIPHDGEAPNDTEDTVKFLAAEHCLLVYDIRELNAVMIGLCERVLQIEAKVDALLAHVNCQESVSEDTMHREQSVNFA